MSVFFWPLLFLALGLLLLVIEIFVPSGGFLGFGAVACLGLSLYYAWAHSMRMAITFLLIDLIVTPATAALAFSLWSRTPLARRVFLEPPATEEIEGSHPKKYKDHLVGEFGYALTPLRPAGHVELRGERFDGRAEDGLIPAGTKVLVVRVRSGELIVRGLAGPDA